MAEPSTAVVAEPVVQASQLPAVLGGYKISTMPANRLVEVIQANVAGGISPFDLMRIKVPAGGGIAWTVPSLTGPAESEKLIEGVIVAYSDQRAYWAQEFSGAGTPPDCTARDSRTGIGSPGGNCSKCAFAQFGSAPKKANAKSDPRGQACKQMRLLFIIRPADLLPIVIAVPPTSLKAIRNYFLALASQGTPYYQCITRLGLAADKNADGVPYSLVEPRLGVMLSDEEAARIKMFSDSLQSVFSTVDLQPEDVA